MSSFTDPLLVEITQKFKNDSAIATLQRPFSYHVGSYPSEDIICIPQGFETDFASIPACGRIIFPVMGKAAKAAVLHDYLWEEGLRSNKEISEIFLEAMTVLRVDMIRRTIMYFAVYLFGMIFYKKKNCAV